MQRMQQVSKSKRHGDLQDVAEVFTDGAQYCFDDLPAYELVNT